MHQEHKAIISGKGESIFTDFEKIMTNNHGTDVQITFYRPINCNNKKS